MIIIPDILLDTSFISIALLVWAVVLKLTVPRVMASNNTTRTGEPSPTAAAATSIGGGNGGADNNNSSDKIVEKAGPALHHNNNNGKKKIASENPTINQDSTEIFHHEGIQQSAIKDEYLGQPPSPTLPEFTSDAADNNNFDDDDLVAEEFQGGVEDEVELEEEESHVDSSQCGDSKDATPLSSTPGSPKQTSGLSRRQKKNRKKVRKKQSQSTPQLSRTSSEELRSESVVSMKNNVPCKQYVKLDQLDQEIYKMLIAYALSLNQMRQLGFPMQSTLYPGKAYIYRDPDLVGSEVTSVLLNDILGPSEVTSVLLNATAQEFIPSSSLVGGKKPLTTVNSSPTIIHSGNSDPSSPSCPPGDPVVVDGPKAVDKCGNAVATTLGKCGNPVASTLGNPATPSTSSSMQYAASSPNLFNHSRDSQSDDLMTSSVGVVQEKSSHSITTATVENGDLLERRCVRCSKSFYMYQSGQYYSKESCTYHWGKLRTDLQQYGDIYQTYHCCGAQAIKVRNKGCSTAKMHVWSGFPINGGIFGPLDGFIKTRTMKGACKEVRYTVYGLDCEMCYTTIGLELTKVTVVGLDGKLVYETLVRPENEIIDYNTRFSGITGKDYLVVRASKSLKEVQQDINGFISADSILIGHGLENDLRALKVIHDHVIDTSLVFPHFYGLPYRRSLRSLARSYLKREIQGNVWGHDSYEDARASIELMLWKVRKDMEKSQQAHDILTQQPAHHHHQQATEHRHI